MINNYQDKGYITIRLKEVGDDLHLCEMGFDLNPDELSFNIDYEDGTIYIDWKDGSPRKTIGYYESTADSVWLAKDYDESTTRVIGSVGQELIYFRSRDVDYSAGRYSPDEACLAYYSQAGRITPATQQFSTVGLINGSEIGGAAAFVALFFTYDFKSIYRDYLELDSHTFKARYCSF